MTPTDLSPEAPWVPSSCTLPTVDQPLRAAEFDGLFASTVDQVERTSPSTLRLTLHPAPDVAAATAQLAAREVQCCGFFTFTLTLAASSLILDVAVPDGRIDVLEGLQYRAARAQA